MARSRILITSIFIANILVTGYFWWLGSSSYMTSGRLEDAAIGLGRLAGLIGELFILVQLVLISRIAWVEKTYGFDKLNQLHRRVGYGLLAGLLLHPLLITWGYAASAKVNIWVQLSEFLTNWDDVFKAFIGLGIILCIGLMSLPAIRRKLHYDNWYLVHLGMYVSVILIFGHQVNTADVSYGAAFLYWYAVNFGVFGLLILYRIIKPAFLWHRHRFVVERVVPETPNVSSVYISGRSMDRFTFDPGQYIHVHFLTKDLWPHHPFSISIGPNGKFIRLSIKAVGDYTRKIPSLNPGTPLLIEGPFGRFTERAALKDKYLLIAGGIGITPIRSLAESLAKKGKDAVLIYGNRSLVETALLSELKELRIPLHLVFSDVREEGHTFGRIDQNLIAQIAPDFRDREIYVCGPGPMMDSLAAGLRKSGVPKRQIHYEKFAY